MAATLATAAVMTISAPARAASEPVTACTALDICYCVHPEFKDAIAANVARVRALLADQRAQGKAIGYLSVPLSAAGGGSFVVNTAIAAKITERVTERFGPRAVFVLNPGAEGGDGLQGASGADYMYMWTQILEGDKGLGEAFDFVYFSGPNDFGRYFELTGTHDFEKLEAWFDDKIAPDPKFKDAIANGGLTRNGFRNYYGLRASVAFSYGSHDEWNIARMINDRRRGATDYGIANQLAVFFNGQPTSPGGYESPTAAGDVGRCIK
uniref:hypothetical protein n=1 Tax=Bradyrhizobium sp. (strain ORS 278) TaxID=114615 RepID=UPI0002EDEA53|nr:hypothetical protein [Bradyrhizobium sp. ORS 278]